MSLECYYGFPIESTGIPMSLECYYGFPIESTSSNFHYSPTFAVISELQFVIHISMYFRKLPRLRLSYQILERLPEFTVKVILIYNPTLIHIEFVGSSLSVFGTLIAGRVTPKAYLRYLLGLQISIRFN
jgi:hypothetical protein